MPSTMPQQNRVSRFLSRVPAFRAKVEERRASEALMGYLSAVLLAVAATGLRFWLDPYLPPGFPYLTFFPAVVLCGFVFGLGPAVLCATLSGLAAWFWFIPPVDSFELSHQSWVALAFFIVVVAIDLGVLQLALVAYRDQARVRQQLERAIDVQQTVSLEVDHRMKNLLATVSGLVTMSSRHTSTAKELATSLNARVHSMSAAVDVLRGSLHGSSATLRQVVTSALATLGVDEPDRASLKGEVVPINSTSIVAFNLLVHELGTNAIKYGALSTPGGRIDVSWTRLEDEIRIEWREAGGPSVTLPTRSGFGSDLIKRMTQSLGGGAKTQYDEAGIGVTITVKAQSVLDQ